MNLIQGIDYARSLIGEPLSSTRTFPDDSSTFFRDTDLVNFYNQAQQEVFRIIVNAHENYFLTEAYINTVANCETYALDSSVYKIMRVEDIQNTSTPLEILPVSLNEKETYDNDSRIGTTGFSRYYLIGKSIGIKETPDATTNCAIRYYYIGKPGNLSASGDTSDVPETYHELLSIGTFKRALVAQQSDPQIIAEATQDYKDKLRSLRDEIENRQVQRPRFVVRYDKEDY